MNSMFFNSSSFNEPLEARSVGKVAMLDSIFYGAFLPLTNHATNQTKQLNNGTRAVHPPERIVLANLLGYTRNETLLRPYICCFD